MVDIETLRESLISRGHRVDEVFQVPKNAGDIELVVDGQVLTLEEARALLADDKPA